MAKNIFLQHTATPLPYASQSGGGGLKYPVRDDPDAHAKFISRKLQESRAQDLTQRQVAAIRYKEGLYLEFSGAAQCDLAIKQLENLQKGIRLLNVKKEDNNIVRATVYIPAGQETYFLEKVQAYGMPVGDEENPKNNDLVRSIENVRLAMLDSFWFGDTATMPDENPVWCEIWLRFERNDSSGAELNFTACCNTLEIELNTRRILFPERIVRLGKANKEQLKNLIQCLNNSVNMIIQGEIQPYEKSEGSAHTREMHLHTIPWPAEVLQSLGETEVELRVTLSYFVEPGPGEIGWKNRYRYPSYGLRFDLINTNESIEGFKKRINQT